MSVLNTSSSSSSSSSSPGQLMVPVGKCVERRLVLGDLSEHLVCTLCAGYFIDATCVVECLHTFCRSCILRHLQISNVCPVVTCDVMIHRTKAACSLRRDSVLQNLVYKMVPGLHRNEMECRRKFYSTRPPSADCSLPPVCRGEDDPAGIRFFSPDQHVDLKVQFASVRRDQLALVRYLRCVAAMPVSVLKRFLCQKYQLDWDQSVKMDIIHGRKILPDEIRLIDVCYMVNLNKKYLKLIFRLCRVSASSDIPLAKRRKRLRSVNPNAHKSTLKQPKCEPKLQKNKPAELNSLEKCSLPMVTPRRTAKRWKKKRGVRKFSVKDSVITEDDSREFRSAGVGVSLVVADSVKTLLAKQKSQLPTAPRSSDASNGAVDDRVKSSSAVCFQRKMETKPSSDLSKEQSSTSDCDDRSSINKSSSATSVDYDRNTSIENGIKVFDRSVSNPEYVSKTGSSLKSLRINSLAQSLSSVNEDKRVNTSSKSSSPSACCPPNTFSSGNPVPSGKSIPFTGRNGISAASNKAGAAVSQCNTKINEQTIKATENGGIKRSVGAVTSSSSTCNKKRFTDTSAQTYLALKKDTHPAKSSGNQFSDVPGGISVTVGVGGTGRGGTGRGGISQCSTQVLNDSGTSLSKANNNGSCVETAGSPIVHTKTSTYSGTQHSVKPVGNNRKDITAVLNHLRHNSLSAGASTKNTTCTSQTLPSSSTSSFSRSFAAAIIPIYRTSSTSPDVKQVCSVAKVAQPSVGAQSKPSQLVTPQQHVRRSVPPQLMPISVGRTTPSLSSPTMPHFSGPLHVQVDEYAEHRATNGSLKTSSIASSSLGNRPELKVDRPVFPVVPQIQRLPRNHSVRHIPNPSLLMHRGSRCSAVSSLSSSAGTSSVVAVKVSPTAGSTASPDLAAEPTSARSSAAPSWARGSAAVEETIESVVSSGRLVTPTIFSLQRQLNEAGTTITLAKTPDDKRLGAIS